MQSVISFIDRLNQIVGRTISWAALLMVLITSFVVIMRYGFNWNSIALQEASMYLHALMFMLAIAWTFQQDAHVRVDIFYAKFSDVKKAWVNLLGSIFLLLPLTLFIGAVSLGYVSNSWAQLEGSPETGGLPLVFVLKTAIPAMSLLLIAQAISVSLKSWCTIQRGNA